MRENNGYEYTCNECLYGDTCSRRFKCEYFIPANEEIIDLMIDQMIDEDKVAYYNQWIEYVREFI